MNKNSVISSYMFSNNDLYRLFYPLIIEQFLVYMLGLSDSVMISHVSEAAVSGVSLIEFVMAFLGSLFAALTTGGAVIAGQYLGSKQINEAKEAATQLLWFSTIVSLIMMVMIYLAKPVLFNVLFGQISSEVYNHANTYFMVAGLSIPFLAVYNAGAAIFRTVGNSRLPMQIMMAMNILNVAGSATLIYGFKLGIIGVAIPTLISRILAGIIILYLVLQPEHKIHIKRNLKFHLNWEIIKKILGIGIPYGLENGLFYFGRIIVLSLVASFGTAAIAANAVSGTIVMFEVLPGMAIGMGLTVIISRCVGANDYDQARYFTKKIMGIIYGAHFISCALVLALLPVILKIYGLSDTATSLTTQIVWWHAAFTVLIWPLAYSLPSIFRAAGDATFPMIIGIAAMFFCRIALAYVLSNSFKMGMFGTWVAMFIDWIIKAVIFAYRYFNGRWTTYHAI